MSRLPPTRSGSGSEGYGNSNGYQDEGYQDQYNRSYVSGGPVRDVPSESRRERRAGGYGGFTSPAGNSDSSPVGRPTSLERSRAHRRSGEKKWDTSRSRSRPGSDGNRQIEEVLNYIQQDWDFMMDDQCNPIQIALKLLDSSSLGYANRYDDFRNTHEQLQNALKAIVNEHHQGFNSSIGTFHKIQASIQASQTRVRSLKESLVQAKSNLSTTKPELRGLATSSQNYDDMLQMLQTIESLQTIPMELESRISEKRFLTAVDILQQALRKIRRSEMDNIGALSDLRIYLSNQEHSLTDILIEELHNHLYLKSPYCEDRWKLHSRQVKALSGTSIPSKDLPRTSLKNFLDQLDTSVPMAEDASRNPEADTFQYIKLLVESLNKMSRLDVAIDTIEQRLPVELFKVVDKASIEVEQRHSAAIRGYGKTYPSGKFNVTKGNDTSKAVILNDLLDSLYARFLAISESHRVVFQVVTGIVKRDGLQDAPTLTRSFRELWKLYQSEMRSLLHDYLSTDGDVNFRSNGSQQVHNSVFQRPQRDKSKKMFRFADMDVKSVEIVSERDDLEFILKSSVPGLVSDSKATDGAAQQDQSNITDGSATGHKLLVDPNIFNMGVLLPPSLKFIEDLKKVVPLGSDILTNTLHSFLDDFLINVFLPQLEETVVDLCSQTFIELDAFQQDPQWASRAQKPIFKGTAKFFDVITAFCSMLDKLPHDQAFCQLIITQMVTYFDKCYGWYKAIITRPVKESTGSRLKVAAVYAESGPLMDLLTTFPETQSEGNIRTLLERENKLIIEITKQSLVDELDIIRDKKTVAGLSLLFNSMKWLSSKVANLRQISNTATDTFRHDAGNQRTKRRWTAFATLSLKKDGVPYLPMNQETAVAFDGVVNSYRQLATTVMRTLHLEMRFRAVLYIQKALLGNYSNEQLQNDPDPNVVELNAQFSSFDEEVASYIQPQHHKFIIAGVGSLVDQLIVTLSSTIKVMNPDGCARMQLNILVLQQNLKNIEPTTDLSRSSTYFDFFSDGPDGIIAQAEKSGGKDLGFSYDELKILIELCYSEAMESGNRESALQAKRALDDHLLQLSEHLWQS
ncbi:hypothetical protein M501DRAFT_929556 [Patellaria atrata CBS 101060]|uniref:Exocyst complex component Sec8 n=1 Tax=Patellaria atrata CBS 101060 TaxID=1346257 RepID=A0A9P4SGL0_9PEZI|nr:hypothetical protein M501DRAFT_929556 [Patellaria atrata CBS 101060]